MRKNHTNLTPDIKCYNGIDAKTPYRLSTLVKKQAIREVFKTGKKYTGTYVTLIAKKSESLDTPSKFLYAVTKNVGVKPVKNTIKRKTREVIRAMYSKISNGYHIAIVVHTPRVTFQMLKEDIAAILLKLRRTTPLLCS